MANGVDNAEVELLCDNCGVTTRKDLEWLRDHDEYTCECGTLIAVDARKFRKEISKAEAEHDGVQGLTEKIGR